MCKWGVNDVWPFGKKGQRWRGILSGVLALAILPALQALAGGLEGTWDTDWGQINIWHSGEGFSGHYEADSGAAEDAGNMVLTPEGETLVGYWAEPMSNQRCDTARMGTYYWGRLRAEPPISDTGFVMKWDYCDRRALDRFWHFNKKTDSPGAESVPQSGSWLGSDPASETAQARQASDGFRPPMVDVMDIPFRPHPRAAGNPALEARLAGLTQVIATVSGIFNFASVERHYALSDNGQTSVFDPADDKASVFDEVNFADFNSAMYAPDTPGTRTGADGISCYLGPNSVRWDGTVFSYNARFSQDEDYETFECYLDVVGVVSPDGKTVSMDLSFKGVELMWANNYSGPSGWDFVRNWEVTYRITNLPLSPLLAGNYPACMVYHAGVDTVRQHISVPKFYQQTRRYFSRGETDYWENLILADITESVPKSLIWTESADPFAEGVTLRLCEES